MNLRQQAAHGAVWTGSGTLICTVIQFVQWVVLARLLEPTDFGLMAMCMVVIGLADAFADIGVSSAIIHRQKATSQQLSSLYWLNIFCGIVVFLVIAGASPLAAKIYGEPRLTSLIATTALMFLIVPLGQQFRILLQKELRFQSLARIDLISTVTAALITIVCAVEGYGVWSLITGYLAGCSLRTGMLLWIGWRTWRPSLSFRTGDLKGFISFGAFQVGERLVNYFAANVDYIIIGCFLGPHILGFYTLAYQLVIMPLSKINPIVTRVAFPVFSQRQEDDAALSRGYLEMIRLLAYAICPACIGLAFTAPLLIPLVFGETWRPTIPLLQILCGVGLLKSLGNPSGSLLLAKGRPDVGFVWNLIVAVVNVAAFLLAVQIGVTELAWTYLGLVITYFFIFHGFVLRIVINLRLRDVLQALHRPFIMSVVMGLAVGVASLVFQRTSMPVSIALAGLITIGIVLYGSIVLLLEQAYLADIWRLVVGTERRA